MRLYKTHIQNAHESIGENYPIDTGRLKLVEGDTESDLTKVGLIGDSTLDNGCWVDKDTHYCKKTNTVTHQVANALSSLGNNRGFKVANFAVDGATTSDLFRSCRLNKVLPSDADHPYTAVHQLGLVLRNLCCDAK